MTAPPSLHLHHPIQRKLHHYNTLLVLHGGNSPLFELTSRSAICFVHTHYHGNSFNCRHRCNYEESRRRGSHMSWNSWCIRGIVSQLPESHSITYSGDFNWSRWPHHHDSFGHERCRKVHLWMTFWKRCRDWITIILRLAKVCAFYGYGSAQEFKVGKDLLDDRYMYRAAGNVDLKKRTMNSISVSVIWLGSSWQECIELLMVTLVT